jgi:uncharacterized protein YecA (UPF0149 family)
MSFFRRFLKKESPEPEPPLPPQPLPRRNDPCWCGSRKKYKKCHLEEDQRRLARIREKEREKACKPGFG